MALCTVTGILYLPNGQVAKSRTLVLRRGERSVRAFSDGVILPDDILTQTNASGAVNFQAFTGAYSLSAEGRDGGYIGRAVVPDAPTALIADVIAFSDIPATPPMWYASISAQLDAVDQNVADVQAAAGAAAASASTAASSVAAVQTAGTFPLASVAGTANAITANLPPGATLAEGLRVSAAIVSNNTGAATLALNGGAAQSIRDADGNTLTADTMKAGRTITFERRGATWRIIGGSVSSADIVAITPLQVTITNATNAAGRTLAQYTTPNTDIVLNPNSDGGVIIGVPPSKGNLAAVNVRVTVRRRGDAVVMTYFATAKTYEMLYVGGVWGAWVDATPYVPAARATVNADSLNAAGRNFSNMTLMDTTYTSTGSAIMANAPPNTANAYIIGKWQTFDHGPLRQQRVWINGSPAYSFYERYQDKDTSTWSVWVLAKSPVTVGPTLLAFGDSITAGVGVGANDPDGYALRTASLLNAPITRLATAGRMMCGTTAGDLIPTVDLAANAATIAAAQVIWIAYGTNDWGGNNPIGTEADTANGTFFGAMREGLTKIRALNATAKICFLTPIYRGHAYSDPKDWSEAGQNSLGLYVEDYRQAIRRFCAINGIPVSEMSANAEINAATAPTYLPADQLHPDRLGHRWMSDKLAERFKSWAWA